MNKIVFDLSVADTNNFKISPIDRALAIAESRKLQITESLKTIKVIKPECDELDYALAAASGALCGIIDIFLVGIPKKSVLGSISDKWFADKTKAFAKLCGWKGNDKLSSAILFLEKNFKVSYDQNGLGVSTSEVYDLYPSNHHFKSLGHNPTLLGLFFSILDQYTNSSDFVSVGNHISVKNTSAVPELKGENIVQKIFFAFVNWIGHLMSDASGSSSGKGRGTGIPSPLLCWTNDIIVLKSKLGLSHTDFINQINELAVTIYKNGFDIRFQAAQSIPVLINEMLVRFIYCIRRFVKLYSESKRLPQIKQCLMESYSLSDNPTLSRMLAVAHGTFCIMDVGDAAIQGFVKGGGTFNPVEFLLRINITGICRFTVSLYGEVKKSIFTHNAERDIIILHFENIQIKDYIESLQKLSHKYDVKAIYQSIESFKSQNKYAKSLKKTVELANKWDIPHDEIIHNIKELDKTIYEDLKNGRIR